MVFHSNRGAATRTQPHLQNAWTKTYVKGASAVIAPSLWLTPCVLQCPHALTLCSFRRLQMQPKGKLFCRDKLPNFGFIDYLPSYQLFFIRNLLMPSLSILTVGKPRQLRTQGTVHVCQQRIMSIVLATHIYNSKLCPLVL